LLPSKAALTATVAAVPRPGSRYRALDKRGRTVDFRLSEHRDIEAAKQFFRQALRNNRPPRIVTLDAYRATHRALRLLRREHPAWRRARVRTCKYLNNIVEQDHRGIKSRTGPMLGFQLFNNAATAIAGIELIRRIKKGQFKLGQFAGHRKTIPQLGGGARGVVRLAAPFTTTLPRLSRFAPEPFGAIFALQQASAFYKWFRMLRVMLVDDTQKDVSLLKEALDAAGYEVVAEERSPATLLERVGAVRPDVIIIDTDSPSRDVLEQVVIVSRDDPRPIVMFTDDGNSDTIQAAIKAGVTAYIVAGMQPERLKPILEVAQARFEADRALREELKTAQGRLAERKIIEKAKGVVMQQKQISEDDAYRLMRKLAMDRNVTLLELAQQLLNVTQLLS
jgi:two-component system, response regulator / RNA-binding antiterminator